jgi:type II secretory pathway component GspD/PulD (secretin)/tetratricopeptide (TPR) repeat protein
MIKAAILSLGLAVALALPALAPAQDNSTAIAVNEAVLRQANTIVLRQKLADARKVQQGGDVAGAAKLYQESTELAVQIGSGIDAETAAAINGLAETRLALARANQARGDLVGAANQANQVLKADPKNPAALAFKKQNEQMIAAMKGRLPSTATQEQVPQIIAQKTDAATLVQDGKLLYEMGKLQDAEAKLNQALALDPDNAAAYYYMNLIQQTKFSRENSQHVVDTQQRMTQVEKQWVLPDTRRALPTPNAYATNTLVYTGPGRQAIIAKLDRIRLDNVSFDGLPLTEVLRTLAEQSKLRDPERKGISFLINPNSDQSGPPVASAAGGGGSAPVDPATGLPAAAPAPAGEAGDVGATLIKIPSLTDVRMADVLDAIVLVADHPIKYSVQDFAIVFSAKAAETPALFTRIFKVDPNTFYSGLESVSAQSFGGVGSSGSGGSGGGGGGGNRGGGGGGGGNNQNSGGAVVGIVNAFSGAGGLRSSGNGNGGGGNRGGGNGGGAADALDAGNAQGAGGGGSDGGLKYITQRTMASSPSIAARAFFTALGVNLEAPPGKSVFFNDRLGKLFVKATEQDLDTIERAIEMLNEVAPQVHVKSRFIEVSQDDDKALGFDWYLGQFNIGNQAVGTGGSSPSLNVPTSAGNPLGAFPGNTVANVIPGSPTDQLLTGGLRNLTGNGSSSTPVLGTITGILTDPNFRMVLHALEQRSGVETLAEPEATTTSGRQAQMRATKVLTIITGVNTDTSSSGNNNNNNNNNGGGGSGTSLASITYDTSPIEIGPILDIVPYVLSDGYTINLALIPSLTDFNGYDTPPNLGISSSTTGNNIGYVAVAPVLPDFTVRQVVTSVNVWDNQTVALGGLISSQVSSINDKVPVMGNLPFVGRLFQSQSKTTTKKNLMIFVTATIVDPAGNRVHSDDDLPFAQSAIPPQPPGAGQVRETVKEVHELPAANP